MAPITMPPQEYMIEPFSSNGVDNAKRVLLSRIGDPSTVPTALDFKGYVVAGANWLNVTVNTFDVTVNTGKCAINGILIEITSTTALSVTDDTHYIVPGDARYTADGTHDVYVIVYYNPTIGDQDAYVCLATEAKVEEYREYICILGRYGITMVDGGIVSYDDWHTDVKDRLFYGVGIEVDGGVI
jgi:hypothetical protein